MNMKDDLFKEDLLSLSPRSGFTRREFVITVLASGFAAAVRPVSADTVIATDTKGLIAAIPRDDIEHIREIRARRAVNTNTPHTIARTLPAV